MSLATAMRITDRVLGIRDDVKSLLGASYSSRIAEYRAIVRDAAERFGCGPLEAPLRLARHGGGLALDEVAIALLVAASVEEAEATS